MAAGSPFAAAHTFTQTGPFRRKNLARGFDNVVLAGSGTVPGGWEYRPFCCPDARRRTYYRYTRASQRGGHSCEQLNWPPRNRPFIHDSPTRALHAPIDTDLLGGGTCTDDVLCRSH